MRLPIEDGSRGEATIVTAGDVAVAGMGTSVLPNQPGWAYPVAPPLPTMGSSSRVTSGGAFYFGGWDQVRVFR